MKLHLNLIAIGVQEFEFQQTILLRLLGSEGDMVFTNPAVAQTLKPPAGDVGMDIGVGEIRWMCCIGLH